MIKNDNKLEQHVATISAWDGIFQIKALGGFIKEWIIDLTKCMYLPNMRKQKAIRIEAFADKV